MEQVRLWLQFVPYDPYSINLQIYEFLLKFSNKFSYKCTSIVVNICLDHMQKENFWNFVIYYGKLRPKGQKKPEKSGDPVPVYSAHPSKSCHGHPKWMKLFVVVVPTKNSITSQKMDQKSIYKGPGAVALILAFFASSKA